MTPLVDALRARAARDTARFHMPGHAGRAVLDDWDAVFAVDFTELSDTGNLYAEGPEGPIRAAERLLADCCGASDCLFLTGGATQGVLTLLSAFASPGDTVILDRNCHFSVHNALALMDLTPVWVQAPLLEPFGITTGLPPEALRAALDDHPETACVLVTSPTYYGVLSDLTSLAELCRSRGVPLLVDAAHGAHLPFLKGGMPGASRPVDFSSPVAQGVSAAVLSAHKTLPALGQSAFVLTGDGVSPSLLRQRAALFGSSSPSYALLASLDAARAYMEAEGGTALAQIAGAAEDIRQSSPLFLGHHPTPPLSIDPLRLCVYTGAGFETAASLEKEHGVVCEMADTRNVVFLLSPLHTQDDMSRLKAALQATLPSPPCQPAIIHCQLSIVNGRTPRQALFAPRMSLPWRDALGRVAAEPVSPYPPGTPLLARGEKIDEDAMLRLERAGFEGSLWVLA